MMGLPRTLSTSSTEEGSHTVGGVAGFWMGMGKGKRCALPYSRLEVDMFIQVERWG